LAALVFGKRIGRPSFHHSLATNLRALGVDINVAQELMRNSSCGTTLDVYTRAVDQQKREAPKGRRMDAAAGPAKVSAPFRTLGYAQGQIGGAAKYLLAKEFDWWT
jgi:hypothetical protein